MSTTFDYHAIRLTRATSSGKLDAFIVITMGHGVLQVIGGPRVERNEVRVVAMHNSRVVARGGSVEELERSDIYRRSPNAPVVRVVEAGGWVGPRPKLGIELDQGLLRLVVELEAASLIGPDLSDLGSALSQAEADVAAARAALGDDGDPTCLLRIRLVERLAALDDILHEVDPPMGWTAESNQGELSVEVDGLGTTDCPVTEALAVAEAGRLVAAGEVIGALGGGIEAWGATMSLPTVALVALAGRIRISRGEGHAPDPVAPDSSTWCRTCGGLVEVDADGNARHAPPDHAIWCDRCDMPVAASGIGQWVGTDGATSCQDGHRSHLVRGEVIAWDVVDLTV